MSTDTVGSNKQSSVEELSNRLGSEIAELPVYQQFVEAKEAVDNSETAQEKIAEFEQQRQEFMLSRQHGNATQEDVQQLQQVQAELNSIPVMDEYYQAQNELNARLEKINDSISEQLAIDFGQNIGGCCED